MNIEPRSLDMPARMHAAMGDPARLAKPLSLDDARAASVPSTAQLPSAASARFQGRTTTANLLAGHQTRASGPTEQPSTRVPTPRPFPGFAPRVLRFLVDSDQHSHE